ncbi:hypothetical protein [Budvicia aquatica]|uniref:hypothetical protein n=1 Tax=Budvicia aquatica TaxID=82979 RepID=UPI002088192E|nr:hypothetical protein [Budvicia aquatica]GKX52708.1 hypothetical protein SOASR029_30170 [Budvicia aquatica]
MKLDNFKQLHPYLFCRESAKVVDYDYYSFFPKDYISLIQSYQGMIAFENGAVFRIKSKIPVITKGYITIDYLYGDSKDENGLNYNIFDTFDIMPDDNFLTFGECFGGNKVCVHKNTGNVYFFWHEEPSDDECYYYLTSSIDIFIESLEPDPEEGNTQGLSDVTVSQSLLELIKNSKYK